MYLKILAHPVFVNLNFHMPMIVDLSHPLVMLQGGNTTSPLTLGWIRPLIESYRVYAPDTLGHPGKSAPARVRWE